MESTEDQLSSPLSDSNEEPKEQSSQCSINRKLLPVKGYYFVFMAAVGDLLPFIALYMKQIGLSSEETGIIYGIMPFVGFFMRPVFGAVADKYKRHKLVLMIVTVLTGVFYLLLVVVPHRQGHKLVTVKTSIECNRQDSYITDCLTHEHTDRCSSTLTQFINTSFTKASNSSASNTCQFTCSIHQPQNSNFKSCFTDESGTFENIKNCSYSKTGSTVDFKVSDLMDLSNRKITRNNINSQKEQCENYDIKNVIPLKLNKESFQILCDRDVVLKCSVICSKNIDCNADIRQYEKTFFAFFFIFLIANITFAPIFPILDAAAYDVLGEQRHKWGKQRIWGTFGFASFAVTSTFIMYLRSQDKKDINYTVSFYIFAPLCFIAAVIAYFLNISSDIKCGQFLKNVWKLLSYKEVFAFLTVVMYFGMLTGGLEAFLFWYLAGLGSLPLVFGLILVVNCFAEMPMLWLAGEIMKHLNLVPCLYLALFCYGLRLLVYSILQNPWFVLLVEPVHGVTFALMYAAASSYASIIAPPGMSATVQGLLGGVHFGFGKGLGSLLTGYMFKSLGARWTWRVYSIVSVLLLVVYFLLNTFVFKSQHETNLNIGDAENKNPVRDKELQENNLLVDTDDHNTVLKDQV